METYFITIFYFYSFYLFFQKHQKVSTVMKFYSKSRSWKSVGADLEVVGLDVLLPGVVFKRVLLVPALPSALGKDDLELFVVVLFILSPVSVELDEETSVKGGIGLWPLLLISPLTSGELEVA